jgi:hypothetical protein
MMTVEAQKAVEEAAKRAAADPAAARAAVSAGTQSFWEHLKAEVSRDVAAFKGDVAHAEGDPSAAVKRVGEHGGGHKPPTKLV